MRIVNGFLLFWKEWPSNWCRENFLVDGVQYNCIEQWMMSEKAKVFKDNETYAKIMGTLVPREQKAFGREVKGYDDEVWAKVRYNIVLRGIVQRFLQNNPSRLLDTKGLTLVEASPEDKIWGVGLGENDPRIENQETWLGQNLLGKALTEARTIITDW